VIPVLETKRLRLRGHEPRDFTEAFAMWSDPVVVRFIGGKPNTEQQVWSKQLAYAGLWTRLGFGYWAVEEKETGKFVGELGFADFKRELTPSIQGVPELGWAFVTRVHGQGYATEGVQAAIAWGDQHLKSKRTVCMIDPENVASQRVAQKCGYQEYARTTYNGAATVLFEKLLGL